METAIKTLRKSIEDAQDAARNCEHYRENYQCQADDYARKRDEHLRKAEEAGKAIALMEAAQAAAGADAPIKLDYIQFGSNKYTPHTKGAKQPNNVMNSHPVEYIVQHSNGKIEFGGQGKAGSVFWSDTSGDCWVCGWRAL